VREKGGDRSGAGTRGSPNAIRNRVQCLDTFVDSASILEMESSFFSSFFIKFFYHISKKTLK
jgi:hypothetical protein